MTRSVEIPEAAVEAACDLTYLGKQLTPSHARSVLTAALPYLAPAAPFANRAGRAYINEQTRLTEEVLAAPAVPQPASLPKCSNCESESFTCAGCGVVVESWELAVPQPVDRVALDSTLTDHELSYRVDPNLGVVDPQPRCGCGWVPDSWETEDEFMEYYREHRTAAVLAVLAGEQERPDAGTLSK